MRAKARIQTKSSLYDDNRTGNRTLVRLQTLNFHKDDIFSELEARTPKAVWWS